MCQGPISHQPGSGPGLYLHVICECQSQESKWLDLDAPRRGVLPLSMSPAFNISIALHPPVLCLSIHVFLELHNNRYNQLLYPMDYIAHGVVRLTLPFGWYQIYGGEKSSGNGFDGHDVLLIPHTPNASLHHTNPTWGGAGRGARGVGGRVGH